MRHARPALQATAAAQPAPAKRIVSRSLSGLAGFLPLALLLVPAVALAETYYVATTGDDANPGTEGEPFASWAGAEEAAQPGDTIYFKGGVYAYDRGTTTCASGTSIISGIVAAKSGNAGNLIKYWAAPGEKPVLDFDAVRDSCRIKGILLSGDYIHIKGFEIRGVRQNNNLNHESWGIWISGDNNIVEQIDAHHIMGAGVFISGGANNLILNCDSHDNLDELTSNGAGESADGFGCHGSGGGNIIRGCRAWWNADDGYDFINAQGHCLVEDSWAWYNGYEPGTLDSIGNGNGFKAGGFGLDTATFPDNPPEHTVRRCLAVANKAAGFYANHHPGSLIFHNNTAYDNHPNFNMLGITSSGADLTVGEYRNNVGLAGTMFSNNNNADEANNAWTIGGITVAADDFQNVSVDELGAPREADGSLPNIPNFRLAAGSDLIDRGVDVGLPFAGSAPDLGWFENGLEPEVAPSVGGAGGEPNVGMGGAANTGGSANTGGAANMAGANGLGGQAVGGNAGLNGNAGEGSVTDGGSSGLGPVGAGGNDTTDPVPTPSGPVPTAMPNPDGTTVVPPPTTAPPSGTATPGPALAPPGVTPSSSMTAGAGGMSATAVGDEADSEGCACSTPGGGNTPFGAAFSALCGAALYLLRRSRR